MTSTRAALWRMCDPPEGLSGARTDLLMLFSSDSQGLHCSNLLETAVRMTAVHVRVPDWLGTPPGPIRDRGVSKPVIESSKPLGTLVRELSPPRSTSVGMGSLSLTKVPPPGSPGPPEGESGRSPGVRDSFAGGRHRRHHPDRFGRAPLRTQSVGPARARGGHAFSSCRTLQGPIGPESGHVLGRAAPGR